MLGNPVETIERRSQTSTSYILYPRNKNLWLQEKVDTKKTSSFSTAMHCEKNNSILSGAIVSAILLERWRNRWFVKDIDSIGQRHWSRRCLPSSVHCEIVCRYESLVIKRILRLSEFHPSLLREVHNCIFNADTRAPVCRRGRKRGKTRYQRERGRERERSNPEWRLATGTNRNLIYRTI